MNRQKKLVVLIGVLVVLCAVIAIVSGVQKHIDTISTVDEEIYATAESALTDVSWTKDGSTLHFVKENDTWQDASDADFPIDQDKMSDFLDHFESVHASFIIENVEDYGQYGLDNPSCTITFTSADGVTEFVFTLTLTREKPRSEKAKAEKAAAKAARSDAKRRKTPAEGGSDAPDGPQ